MGPFFVAVPALSAGQSHGAAPHGGAGPGWLLLAAAAALPWLIVPSGQPWPGFNRDWLQAFVWLVGGGAACWRLRDAWTLPAPALGFAVVALVPLAQAALGVYADSGDAWLPTLTLAGIALAITVAARLQRDLPLRLADALLAGITMAAIASVALALLQWLRLDVLGPLSIAQPQAGRPAANLGQPNLLATLLLWGLVGAAWGHWRGQVRRATLLLLCAWLLFGVVLTQSRTGLLGVLVLALFVGVARRRANLTLPVRSLAILGLVFVCTVLAWPMLNGTLALDAARSSAEVGSAGKRPEIWAAMFDAVGRAPWFGYGWNQGIAAHLAVAAERPPLHVIVQHAHNLGLDLLVWNGIVLGSLIALGVVTWFIWHLIGAVDAPRWLLMAALSVFAVHALLELPHTVLAFLIPVALMAGTIEGIGGRWQRWALPLGAARAAIMIFAVLLVILGVEYRRVEEDLLAHRMIRARIGNLTPPPPPNLWPLAPLQRSMEAQRIEPRSAMPNEEIEALDRSALRHAAAGALFNSARAAALNGRPEAARLRLRQLCAVHPQAGCRDAALAWGELGRTTQPALAAVPFEGR